MSVCESRYRGGKATGEVGGGWEIGVGQQREEAEMSGG